MRSSRVLRRFSTLSFTGAFLFVAMTGCLFGDEEPADDDSAADEWPDFGDDDDTGPHGSATLTHVTDTCMDPGYLYPSANNVGHFAAVKLEPEGWPFRVKSIRYLLEGGTAGEVQCRPDLAHRVQIYAASSSSPPADGEVAYQFDIPASSGNLSDRTVYEHVYPELELSNGQDLYIAVELVGEYPEVMCLSLCYDAPVESGNNWWSHATEPPFDWDTLEADGVDADIHIEADGTYY